MTRVNLEIPSSIHQRAKELAERDGVSLDQLVALALAEKMSALDTVNYLEIPHAPAAAAKNSTPRSPRFPRGRHSPATSFLLNR